MIKYHQDSIDFQSLPENNIDRLQLQMIPPNSRVLEIGCATGYMSEYLIKEQGCQVIGVEPVKEQAEAAMARGMQVYTGNIDNPAIQAELDRETARNGAFDVLFMSQVIEHIADPEAILQRIKEWLSPNGILVISTCNIAHWQCRFRLLAGKWEYETYGIFDKSHLRFFTIKSFHKMLSECGYDVTDFAYTFEDICPFKILFDKRLLAPSDILRLIPLVGPKLRKKYTDLTKKFIATQFVFKTQAMEKKTS